MQTYPVCVRVCVCESAHTWIIMTMYGCVCCMYSVDVCWVWPRGEARMKPHSRSTVVWNQWNVSAFPYVCKSPVLRLSLCVTETTTMRGILERGGRMP